MRSWTIKCQPQGSVSPLRQPFRHRRTEPLARLLGCPEGQNEIWALMIDPRARGEVDLVHFGASFCIGARRGSFCPKIERFGLYGAHSGPVICIKSTQRGRGRGVGATAMLGVQRPCPGPKKSGTPPPRAREERGRGVRLGPCQSVNRVGWGRARGRGCARQRAPAGPSGAPCARPSSSTGR